MGDEPLRQFGLCGEAPQTDQLICENESRERDENEQGKRGTGQSQAQLRGQHAMHGAAPKDKAGGEPLKRNCGGVQREALDACGVWALHQQANAATAEDRHSDREKKKNEREVPMHGAR